MMKSSVNPNDNITLLKFDKKEESKNLYDAPELKVCPECDAKTYGDLCSCSVCGKTICEGCAYFNDTDLSVDGSLEIDDYLCEECYEKAHSEDVSAEPDNSTLFDILTAELESESD